MVSSADDGDEEAQFSDECSLADSDFDDVNSASSEENGQKRRKLLKASTKNATSKKLISQTVTKPHRGRLVVIEDDNDDEDNNKKNFDGNNSNTMKLSSTAQHPLPRTKNVISPTLSAPSTLRATSHSNSINPATISHNNTTNSNNTNSNTSLTSPEGVVGRGSHEHNFFDFLQPTTLKDHLLRPRTHPEFNRRTLHVPNSFLKDQTPAMLQWWAFKKDNMDTVLFFKVGKFYELFHMDADVGFSELDLIYMKGFRAHSGFPEISYGKFASTLVSKGEKEEIVRISSIYFPISFYIFR